MTQIQADPRLIIALDLPDTDLAWSLVDQLGDAVSFYKIGLQLIPVGGMQLAERLKAAGKQVFLDYKLHDIPATVEKATRNLAGIGADMLTVHAEPPVMKAAVEGKDGSGMNILGVTVLTSNDEAMLEQIGYRHGVRELVMRRVDQAVSAGVDGVVASALEAEAIRERVDKDFLIVTPGIRPAGADAGDQKRVATPASALTSGSTHLVVGRPVNAAADPRRAAQSILTEIASV